MKSETLKPKERSVGEIEFRSPLHTNIYLTFHITQTFPLLWEYIMMVLQCFVLLLLKCHNNPFIHSFYLTLSVRAEYIYSAASQALLRYHTSTCFRPICTPSSGGQVYNVAMGLVLLDYKWAQNMYRHGNKIKWQTVDRVGLLYEYRLQASCIETSK
jgi:hypothetical protein